ncbi:MAG: hypothetical protein J3K34DRAFT_449044 [Monoraphidium minutum]|nr:MAG: hypothetical protein J3K34DRAFT_449044 [Monoraphidium minutum]
MCWATASVSLAFALSSLALNTGSCRRASWAAASASAAAAGSAPDSARAAGRMASLHSLRVRKDVMQAAQVS